jgi:hypothetical protein
MSVQSWSVLATGRAAESSAVRNLIETNKFLFRGHQPAFREIRMPPRVISTDFFF